MQVTLSVPKCPGRPVGPCGTVVLSVLHRMSKGPRTKCQNLSRMAILGWMTGPGILSKMGSSGSDL